MSEKDADYFLSEDESEVDDYIEKQKQNGSVCAKVKTEANGKVTGAACVKPRNKLSEERENE